MTWLEELMQETVEIESPRQYVYWAGLSALSAVLRNKVWLNRGGKYKLFPNIYVLLLGKSGLRKGLPVSIAKRLVESLKVTRTIAGRISIQGLLKELSQQITTPDGAVFNEPTCFLVSGEYASFLIEDPAAIYILTDLHDTHAHEKGWTNTLAGDTKRHLEFPCITFLGGSNQINLAETLPKSANGGGFVARTFMVSADKKSKINSLMFAGPEISYDGLLEHLKKVSELRGEFRVTEECIKFADTWYINYERKFEEEGTEDPTGTLQRIFDQILKLSMLESVADNTDMWIETRHFTRAVNSALGCLPGMKSLMITEGTTVIGEQTKCVIRILIKATDHQLSRKKLVSKGISRNEFDAFDLDRIVETMMQAEWIKTWKEGGETMYKLLDEAIEFVMGAL